MCATCKKAAKKSPKEALQLIEQAIEGGSNPEHFDDLLNRITGMATVEVNEELDAAYEEERE